MNGKLDDKKCPCNSYYVCNTDEPYAAVVYQVILGGEVLKNGAVFVFEDDKKLNTFYEEDTNRENTLNLTDEVMDLIKAMEAAIQFHK